MRPIRENVWWCGAVDWDRRCFDALVPLPDGTSYNAYLVRGTEKTALVDAVDETMADVLLEHLQSVPSIDYIISQHSEQDHSGTIPRVLQKYPQAKVLATAPGRNSLIDLLHLPEDRVVAVKDGETLSLGGKTLKFITVPWVHWPDTMSTYLQEDRILFTCDFFGSHLATSDLYVTNETHGLDAAKRYYAEIMMPYSKQAAKDIEKIAPLAIDLIAPSHGPMYDTPALIVDAWKDWTSPWPKNLAVVPFVSMHHSTLKMADHLVGALTARGVAVERFDLTATDTGRLAMALVDAATVLIGTPAVLNGVHPLAAHAAFLTNALKPKFRFAGLFGSYGWGAKALENPAALLPDLTPEFLPPVLCKGAPREADFQALDRLADTVAEKHRALAARAVS